MTAGEWMLICGYCVMAGYFWRVIETAIRDARNDRDPES